MHGFILTSIERFVTTVHGVETWSALLVAAGLPHKRYESWQEYPDDEVMRLFATGAQFVGEPLVVTLERFGRFLAADLLAAFRPLIDPAWRTLELLEHVEATMHDVVRARTHNAHPPVLRVTRSGAGQVNVVYDSPRRLGAIAVGIVHGVADHYGEAVEITALASTADGQPADVYRVRTVSVAVERGPAARVPPRVPAAPALWTLAPPPTAATAASVEPAPLRAAAAAAPEPEAPAPAPTPPQPSAGPVRKLVDSLPRTPPKGRGPRSLGG